MQAIVHILNSDSRTQVWVLGTMVFVLHRGVHHLSRYKIEVKLVNNDHTNGKVPQHYGHTGSMHSGLCTFDMSRIRTYDCDHSGRRFSPLNYHTIKASLIRLQLTTPTHS